MLHIKRTTNFKHYHMKWTITILLITLSLTSCLISNHSKVALNDNDNEVRKIAISNLTNQTTLSKLALNDNDSEVRKFAISKLTNQTTLSKLALNDNDSEIRKLALKRLK